MLKVVVVSVNVDGGLLLLVVFSHRSASYVSVEEMGISRTLDGNTGWKVTAACQWRGWVGVGGDPASHPNLDPCPLPFLWVSPHTDSHTCLPVAVQSIRCHSVAPDNSKLLSSFSDDTLRAGGQAGVCARPNRPRQGAEGSAEGAPASPAARREGRQPPATEL